MILIDTSVWIEFFKQNATYFDSIASMLKNKQVIAHEIIFSELIYGVRTKKDKEKILSYWNVLPRIESRQRYMLSVAEYANNNNFHNLGIGLIDAVIVKSAQEGNHKVWTLDEKINRNVDEKFLYKLS